MRSLRSKRDGNSISCFLSSLPNTLFLLVASILSLLAIELIVVLDRLHRNAVMGLAGMTDGESSRVENHRPDRSSASSVIEALRAMADRDGDEATDKAVAFVMRSQNLESKETFQARIQTQGAK
jgi:hypothetical protein